MDIGRRDAAPVGLADRRKGIVLMRGEALCACPSLSHGSRWRCRERAAALNAMTASGVAFRLDHGPAPALLGFGPLRRAAPVLKLG